MSYENAKYVVCQQHARAASSSSVDSLMANCISTGPMGILNGSHTLFEPPVLAVQRRLLSWVTSPNQLNSKLSCQLWKNHLVFKLDPPTTGLTKSSPKLMTTLASGPRSWESSTLEYEEVETHQPSFYISVLYLSERVHMLLLLLQIPLALLDELINGWRRTRRNRRRNYHLHWWRRDINQVFGTWVVHFYKNSIREIQRVGKVEAWRFGKAFIHEGSGGKSCCCTSDMMQMPKQKCEFYYNLFTQNN